MGLSKKIQQMGQFKGNGGTVPIYGVSAVNLTKSNEWKVINIGIKSSAIGIWKGDNVVEFPFDFELVAGIGSIKSRDDLLNKMKLMHSWAAHTEGENFNAPELVTLSLGQYINCGGSIKTVTTSASGPWDADGNPNSCKFTGIFMLMPGYKSVGDTDIVASATKLSADQVRSSFYQS